MLKSTTKRLGYFLPVIMISGLALGIVALFGVPAVAHPTSESERSVDCTPTEILVNPCKPWLGGFSFDTGSLIANIEGRKGVTEGLEKRTNEKVEVVRAYMPYGKRAINKESKYFIDRPNTILFTNYKPSIPWREGDGRNSTVNTQIDEMADSILANVPEGKKIMLSLDAEPEDDMSSLDPETAQECPAQTFKAKTNSGNPKEYRDMWRNVRNRFDAKGASDRVVWAMNYMGFEKWDCVIKAFYPGDYLVDWIGWDPYISENATWNERIGRFYKLLEDKTDETHQFTSKPWALPEFGSWHKTQGQAYKMYDDARTAVENNTFPRIKLYVIFDAEGVNSSKIEYANATNQRDPRELAAYRRFAGSKAFDNPLHDWQMLPNNLTFVP